MRANASNRVRHSHLATRRNANPWSVFRLSRHIQYTSRTKRRATCRIVHPTATARICRAAYCSGFLRHWPGAQRADKTVYVVSVDDSGAVDVSSMKSVIRGGSHMRFFCGYFDVLHSAQRASLIGALPCAPYAGCHFSANKHLSLVRPPFGG